MQMEKNDVSGFTLRSRPEFDIFKVLLYIGWITIGAVISGSIILGVVSSNRNHSLILVVLVFLLVAFNLIKRIHWICFGQEVFTLNHDEIVIEYKLLSKSQIVKIAISEIRGFKYIESTEFNPWLLNSAYFKNGNFRLMLYDGRCIRFGQSRLENDFAYYFSEIDLLLKDRYPDLRSIQEK